MGPVMGPTDAVGARTGPLGPGGANVWCDGAGVGMGMVTMMWVGSDLPPAPPAPKGGHPASMSHPKGPQHPKGPPSTTPGCTQLRLCQWSPSLWAGTLLVPLVPMCHLLHGLSSAPGGPPCPMAAPRLPHSSALDQPPNPNIDVDGPRSCSDATRSSLPPMTTRATQDGWKRCPWDAPHPSHGCCQPLVTPPWPSLGDPTMANPW